MNIAPLICGLAALCCAGAACAQDTRSSFLPVGCPDLSGQYRVGGAGPTLADVLEVLHARHAGSIGSEVKLNWQAGGWLSVWAKSDGKDPMPAKPTVVLKRSTDFSCKNGALVFKRIADVERRGTKGWLKGGSIVQIKRCAGGGLDITSSFSGRQQTILFSYDSASLGIPRLGTKETLTGTIRWPDISEPLPEEPSARAKPPEPPELREVTRAREWLSPSVLGPVTLGWIERRGEGVVASLTARKSGDVPALEERLRAASIVYEIKAPPVWSNNHYELELLFRLTGPAATRP